jgi:anti-sigma B factor antagonist
MSLGSAPVLVVELSRSPAAAVVHLHGEVDLCTAPQLVDTLGRLIDEGERHLVVDMEQMQFIDSTGLNVLVAARGRVQELGGELRVRRPTRSTRRVLDVAGLAELLPETI